MPKYEADPDDPLAPMALRVPGSTPYMAECLIEEYLMMGYGEEELLTLFRDPFYQGAHQLYRQFGEEALRSLIAAVRGDAPTEETQS